MKVAVTGASGFIGAALIRRLAQDGHQVFAISRSKPQSAEENVHWRKTDLFSAGSTLHGLQGADVAFYLVHSMLPSTTFFQGDFHDTDLLLADNFARACKTNGVKQIIYLGGLVPSGHISKHLESRHEVGGVLRSAGIPVTEIRAGMIVGCGGSSFEILRTLVRRLPIMILPQWTQRKTQAIFIDDVIEVLANSFQDSGFLSETIDLVNGEPLIYEDLLRTMARALHLHRLMIPVPIRSTGFSKLWVTLLGGSHYQLVSPLIDSLLCDLPTHEPSPLIDRWIRFRTFDSMLKEVLKKTADSPSRSRIKKTRNQPKTVRSIQRLPALPGRDCQWISNEYMRWLPMIFKSWIRVETNESTGRVYFYVRPIRKPLLELQLIQGQFDHERKKFHIVGGLLSATRDTGWLEFRQLENRKYTLSAIHEFIPSLPWTLYLMTQAPLHRWVMTRFGRHLEKIT
jgi:uncharacterized protein YbjT (DUF2867 family)